MDTLYVDNFRGFYDTFIPLTDVNFLVGENSTGKTSICGLLEILSHPKFWFEQDFNTGNVPLGAFRDMVSGKNPSMRKMRIGVISKAEDPGETAAYLLTLQERDGLPRITRYDVLRQKHELNMRIQASGLRYKMNEADGSGYDESLKCFKKWCQGASGAQGYRAYEKLRNIDSLSGFMQILLASSELLDETASKNRPSGLRIPTMWRNVRCSAPIRTQPKSTYDELRLDYSAEGAHVPYVLRQALGPGRSATKLARNLERFGRASGLFRSVRIKEYGRLANMPFAVHIQLGDQPRNLKYVGYGVSQVLPVIVELFTSSPETCFMLQQPEIHLHPRAQAALGDTICRLSLREKKKFVVETHSDYMIDRFRLSFRSKNPQQTAQVLFFERTSKGNKVHSINIDHRGRYSKDQPKAFKQFFIKEELKMLGLG